MIGKMSKNIDSNNLLQVMVILTTTITTTTTITIIINLNNIHLFSKINSKTNHQQLQDYFFNHQLGRNVQDGLRNSQ